MYNAHWHVLHRWVYALLSMHEIGAEMGNGLIRHHGHIIHFLRHEIRSTKVVIFTGSITTKIKPANYFCNTTPSASKSREKYQLYG